MKLTNGTTLGNLAIPNAKNLSQFYGSGGQMMHKGVARKAYGGMVHDYMMDQISLPVMKGPPLSRDAPASLKPVLFAKAKAKGGMHMMPDGTMMLNSAMKKAKGGKVSKLKRGGRATKL